MTRNYTAYDANGNPVFTHELSGGDAEMQNHSGVIIRVAKMVGRMVGRAVTHHQVSDNGGMVGTEQGPAGWGSQTTKRRR